MRSPSTITLSISTVPLSRGSSATPVASRRACMRLPCSGTSMRTSVLTRDRRGNSDSDAAPSTDSSIPLRSLICLAAMVTRAFSSISRGRAMIATAISSRAMPRVHNSARMARLRWLIDSGLFDKRVLTRGAVRRSAWAACAMRELSRLGAFPAVFPWLCAGLFAVFFPFFYLALAAAFAVERAGFSRRGGAVPRGGPEYAGARAAPRGLFSAPTAYRAPCDSSRSHPPRDRGRRRRPPRRGCAPWD